MAKPCISFPFLSYSHGNIKDLGRDAEIENRYAKSSFERVLDVSGKTIVPGTVFPFWILCYNPSILPKKNTYENHFYSKSTHLCYIIL